MIAKEIHNILVIRPDAIGDLVLTLPAIQAVKKKFPLAKITVLARPYTAPLLIGQPAVDAVIYDYELGKYKFDLSINYFNEFKDTFAAFKARIPYRLGDSSRVLTGWMNNLRVFRHWEDPTRHEVEFNFDLLHRLGITDQPEKAKITIAPPSLAKAKQLLAEHGWQPNRPLAGIHLGSATSQPWSTSGFAAVIDWLAEKTDHQPILLGGPAEKDRATEVLSMIKAPVINLAGEMALPELIALISLLNFYLGMDTGPTHIAAAFDVPQVMLLLNPNAKPARWGPWAVRHLTVAIEQRAAIPVEEVIAAVAAVLGGGGIIRSTVRPQPVAS
ncbi:MAG: glycosyltransferase family 9 protein [Candidatus Margulisiibacteriota bacterium]